MKRIGLDRTLWFLTVLGAYGAIATIILGVLPYAPTLTGGTSDLGVQLAEFLGLLLIVSLIVIFLLTFLFWHHTQDLSRLETYRQTSETNISTVLTAVQIWHNMNHEARNMIFRLDAAAQLMANEAAMASGNPEQMIKQTKDSLYRLWGMFNINLMANVASLFTLVTGQKCAACVKMVRAIDETDERQVRGNLELDTSIFTYFRDPISNRKRHETDLRIRRYSKDMNTAFSRIMNDDTRDFFFYNNDLRECTDYVNTNARWREFYNSTLVVPIRCESIEMLDGKFGDYDEKAKFELYGFVCLDSIKAAFVVERDLEIACAIADLYFLVFKAFERFSVAAKALQEAASTRTMEPH